VKQTDGGEESRPITRARIGPRKLRKGRTRCEAHRSSDGQPCQAPAIPGGWVCLDHGGSAKQVRIAAARRVLQEQLLDALRGLDEHERGSERWYQAWDRITAAERAIEQYESDLDLIALMRIELTDPSGPEVREWLLQAARDRLAGRPWKSPVRR
jgi:hypothetical protein